MGFRNYIWDEAWELNVSRGKVRGAESIIKFGENLDVDNTLETVWNVGGLYTYLTTAATVTVTSDNVNDSASGTGARTVTVEGLDENYNQVSETLTVGGGAGSIEFLRVFRAFVASAGTSDTNEGTITIASGGTTLATIGIIGFGLTTTGLGQTLMAIYTVPVGYTLYVWQLDVSTAKTAGDVFFACRENGGNNVWRIKDVIHTNINDVERRYKFPLKIPEKSDIEIRAISEGQNMKVAATLDMILIQNETE